MTNREPAIRRDWRDHGEPAGGSGDRLSDDPDARIWDTCEVELAADRAGGLEHEPHVIRDRDRYRAALGELGHDRPGRCGALDHEVPGGVARGGPEIILKVVADNERG